MKIAVALLALVSLAYAAPQTRKSFHEHYEDFMDVIVEESGHEIEHLMDHYLEFEEFRSGIDYMSSKDFKDLVYEMEDLPEFKAVVSFLEGHGIDIMYFIDVINEALESFSLRQRSRHELSGRDISAFIQDCISEFPKDKLTELYNHKISEHEEFAHAMADLESDEWQQLFRALLDSETFKKETQILHEHGIDIEVVIREVTAVFGKF